MGRVVCIFLLLLILVAAIGTQAQIEDITWELGPNLPEFRKGGCFANINGKLISVFGMRFPWGEMATMYVYDPAENLWTQGPDGPMEQCYVEGIECNGSFYSVGGRKGNVHGRSFCLSEKEGKYVWKELAGLNESRGWAPSVSINRAIYVLGGAKSGHGPTLNGVEMLDTQHEEGKWKKISDIPGESRGWCAAAAVEEKIFLIGGLHFFSQKSKDEANRKRLNQVLMFDPQTRGWQEKSSLPYSLSGMDCCVYQDRYIIVVGGASDMAEFSSEMVSALKEDKYYQSYYCPFVLVYDTKLETWKRLPSKLPMPTNDIRAAIIGDKMYVLGGENIDPATSNTTPWLRIGQIIGDK